MREPSRQPDQSPGTPGKDEMRKMWGSLIAEPTAFLDLSQDFIARLRAVAPKPRRPKLRYAAAVVALAVVLFVAITVSNRSVLAMHAPSANAPASVTAPPPALTTAAARVEPQAPVAPLSLTDPTAAAPPSATDAVPQTQAGELGPRPGSIFESARQGSLNKNSRAPRKPHRRAPR
jgi:hypothetical protein